MAVYISRKDKVIHYCTDSKLDKAIESMLDRTDVVKGETHAGYKIRIVDEDYDERIAADAIDKLGSDTRLRSNLMFTLDSISSAVTMQGGNNAKHNS